MSQLTPRAIHTSDARHADQVWQMLGGRIEPIRRTGENSYTHALIERPLRTNGRRHDVPAKLLTLINRVLKIRAANDACFEQTTQKSRQPPKG